MPSRLRERRKRAFDRRSDPDQWHKGLILNIRAGCNFTVALSVAARGDECISAWLLLTPTEAHMFILLAVILGIAWILGVDGHEDPRRSDRRGVALLGFLR